MGKFNFKDEEDFLEVRASAEEFYKSIDKVRCPYFGEEIIFNAKGLRHLKFKSDQQARLRADQYVRLKLVPIAPEVLKRSHTVQGIWKTKRFEEQKTEGRWKYSLQEIIFFEFLAVIDNIRVKVIIKEVEGGNKHFWSVIPFWGIDKVANKRILYSGDPEND